MLDFNHQLKTDNQISNRLNKLIDQALELERQAGQPRKYLGASRLGTPCSRALQYEYISSRQGINPSFNGQILRIFETGHLFEILAIRWLKAAGLELVTEDQNGKQFGFEVAEQRIAGHIDGIIYKAPKKLGINCPALWEAKTMNNKAWKELTRKGLVLSKPLYAAQIALYQAYMEESIAGISANPCLLTAINKDSCDIYHELIPFDGELAQRMSDKAVNIIRATEADELLPRAFSSREFYDCKICSYQSKCWDCKTEGKL